MAIYRTSAPRRASARKLMLCSYPAQAVYHQLLIGVYANQVPGLAEVGAAALAEKMCKPLQSVVDALDELVSADLAEVDAEASLIRLPGVPEDHSHVAVGANNVVGWLKIVKDLSRQESSLLRRHVDELVDVIRSAIAEHSAEGPQSQKLLSAVTALEAYGTRPNPVRTPSEPRPNPVRTNDTEPETEIKTEPDAANAAVRASVQAGDSPALRLLNALADLHPDTADYSQRWKPKNRIHLAAAEALLATDGDPDWPDEVIDIVSDFSAICAKSPEQAKHWLAPRMLALVPSPKSTSGKSAWDTIRSVVASWRAEQRVQAEEAQRARERAAAAERKLVADRLAELEVLARNGESAFNKQLRESGQKSIPAVDYRACLSAAQEALADARRGGRDPTLEEIERAVRAVQEKP